MGQVINLQRQFPPGYAFGIGCSLNEYTAPPFQVDLHGQSFQFGIRGHGDRWLAIDGDKVVTSTVKHLRTMLPNIKGTAGLRSSHNGRWLGADASGKVSSWTSAGDSELWQAG